MNPFLMRYHSSIPRVCSILGILSVSALCVLAQEAETPADSQSSSPTVPQLPANLTPPSGPPPGPPPQLPEALRNRLPANARPAPVRRQASQQATAESTEKKENSISRVTLEDTSLVEVLDLYEQLIGKSILRDQDLPDVTISFDTQRSLPKSEVTELLSELLRMNGVMLVPEERILRAVPTAMPSSSPSLTPMPAAEPEEMVARLTLSDMSTIEVLDLLQQLTGKPILRQQNIPAAKINFDSQQSMAKSEAIIAVESLLSLNGVAITELGDNFLKAVPIGNAPQQVPTFLHGSTLMLPPSQAYYTKLFNLEYLSVPAEATPVIQPLMSVSVNGSLVPFPKANSLLVTDTLTNLQRIEQVLQEADKPQTDPEIIQFFTLSNIKARDMQQRLQSLIGNQQSPLFKLTSNNTVIEADERTNQIILMTHPSNLEMLSNIIEKLDINVEPTTSSRVYYIKHAKAVDIDALLEEIITGQQQVAEESGSNNRQRGGNNNNNNQQQQARAAAAAAASQSGADDAGLRFSEYITIVADERSNAIVAYGTKTDLDQIGAIIDEIDVLLAQVHIEVLIAEVTLNDTDLDGISALNLEYNPIGGLAGFSGAASGPAFNFFGAVNTDTLSLSLDNSIRNQRTRVLSAPVIVTTHNQEATVDVVQSRPFITGSVTSGDGLGGVTNSVEYRDVGIQLTVTPLIGSNGVVQMEIDQVVETIIPGNGENIDDVFQPFIDKRQATSFVSVSDAQTIVLAGLQQSQVGNSGTRLWLLGDLPIVGDLFTSSSNSDDRRELMLFITPYVIYNQEDATDGVNKALDGLDNGEDARVFIELQNMSAVFEKEVEEQPEWPLKDTRKGPRN